LTRAEALELAREIESGRCRSYVGAARELASFFLTQEKAREEKLQALRNRALAKLPGQLPLFESR
jgi:hypothetical protein